MTDGPRPVRALLVGCPRSRTTVAQTVLSQACGLVPVSSNWWLTASVTHLLSGGEGEPREVTRPFARRRVANLLAEVGVELSEGFRVEEALDRLAVTSGAAGWLEKTPVHVLALDEIEAEVAAVRVVHLLRDPGEVVASFLRRAAANPDMRGAAWQSDQDRCEAIWRACAAASLRVAGKANHLLVDAAEFVADPEAVARRVAGFLAVRYLPPENMDRVAAAAAAVPSSRPWKRDAAGPVQVIEHEDS